MTESPMVLEPCADAPLRWMDADPCPHPDLVGQLGYWAIKRPETVDVVGEWL